MTAIMAVTRNLRTLTDGTVRLQVDIEPNDAIDAMKLFGVPTTPIAIAQLRPEFTVQAQQTKTIEQEQGSLANLLHRHGFFRARAVAEKLGSDDLFQKWVRTKPCILTGATQDIEFAHVRRINRGAGTGIKPKFSGVPLHRDAHRYQHQHGEFSALQHFKGDGSNASEFFEKESDQLLIEWVKERFKKKFQVESTKDLDFKAVALWAQENEIFQYLPREIRSLA